MSNLAIQVENVSKHYRLGEVGTGSFSHDLNVWWHKMRGRENPYLKIGEVNDRTVKGDSNYVWALQDINFKVQQGDVLGIIGRNGAGKSTLLKILSKVTQPTTGKLKVKGRIASLLEVGTGFHPELSGRDNIFLNGAILGMTKKEIKRKFDEIVDFAGVERYIDTPVKRYSSGMYVRLAFGVAAHLESEILIVDEVLAVGDSEFQRKCLGKMQDVSKGEGRTVLFVSHNIASIKALCNRGVFLKNGVVSSEGDMENVINAYHNDLTASQKKIYKSKYTNSATTGVFDILEACISNSNIEKEFFTTSESIDINVKYKLSKNIKGGVINFALQNQEQTIFLSFDTDLNSDRLNERGMGVYEAKVELPAFRLKPGIYSITFNTGIANLEKYLTLEKCLIFEIVLADENETFISYASKRDGLVAMPLSWETKKIQ